jgi:two-component system, NtrC family, response regulator HydG
METKFVAAPTSPLIILADDHPDVVEPIRRMIVSWGHRAQPARNKVELLQHLANELPALVLLDLRFGNHNGIDLMQQLLKMYPELPIALLTGHGTIDLAVSAMRQGAYDFLTKPPDINRLQVLVGHAAEKHALRSQIETLETLVERQAGVRLDGESSKMQRAIGLLRSVAPTEATVLVLGESGTGKELAARTVHDLSRRSNGPFIPINMAAMPRELAESLLFGHEKGAFTGADRVQAGACEVANTGTLFLDEIGEMELALQAKLLRFLQERTVQRVGQQTPIQVDVRVVAATNRDLSQRVREGKFREDLFYRLNVVPVTLPPLRERREDILMLALKFLNRARIKYHKPGMNFAPAAHEALIAYDWPGNVRQLENVVERVVILNSGTEIPPEAFAEEFRNNTLSVATVEAGSSGVSESDAKELRIVEQLEKQAIVDSLAKTRGSVRDTATAMGLSQATIYRKLKRYNIDLEKFVK